MTEAEFLEHLQGGKVVNCVYHRDDGLTGLIMAWLYGGRFILTWEECREGDQYNENAYTRDERYEFDRAEDVLAFVREAGYPASSFEP